jgi:RNA polymerase sigma-70 factor (ECF subfamily)
VPAEETDAALVARCREGDEGAWAELVERFSGYVYAILSRGFRMADDESEDVFQEVFARLYEKLDSIRDDDAIRSWLGQTTRRLAVDRYRASARESPAVGGELPEPAELDEQLERLDQALDVRAGLAALSDRCREILTRFFIRDESYAAIGGALDLPAGTVASRISRCLAKLREQLGS